jgi:hypothetical protein
VTVLRYVIDAGVLLLALVGVLELLVFLVAPFIDPTDVDWDEEDERLI